MLGKASEVEFLKWFYANVDLSDKVVAYLKQEFVEATRLELPKGYGPDGA